MHTKEYYITNATFNNWIAIYFSNHHIDIANKKFNEFLNLNKIDLGDLKNIFSDRDRKLLLSHVNAMIFCLNNELDARTADNFTPNYHRRFVFDTPPPAYHADQNCMFLRKDFENLEIPEEIKHQGEKRIKEFLDFADQNKQIFIKDPERFKRLATTRFMLVNAFSEVSYPNSYVTDIKTSLQMMIFEALEIIATNLNVKNMRFAPISKGKKNEDPEVKEWFIKYKQPIYKKIEEELSEFISPSLAFNEEFLQSLKLRPCASCCK
ncbi:hypothetical protein J7560_09930 [Wohlfahrtiimonas chitiniclastica]|uniref:hypothetical protein n=1 Tax=Wohlfahrtiimonas chitiniclastica TaxID=400946 RepID=UPI001BCEEBC3|nr:hypothetical protein [Wohlfahrtiimonas chitiniclastica]MBS7815723.1 hypothetical protein [Wohlfahrtiimonas chitiniclastica]